MVCMLFTFPFQVVTAKMVSMEAGSENSSNHQQPQHWHNHEAENILPSVVRMYIGKELEGRES